MTFLNAIYGVRRVANHNLRFMRTAETSVTIADVVYVVDCGKLKERRHNAARGMSLLVEDFVSQVCASYPQTGQ